MHVSCLNLTKDKTGVHATVCNKKLLLFSQNLMSHVKTTAHRKNVDSKIEARKYIADVTRKMRLSQEEK